MQYVAFIQDGLIHTVGHILGVFYADYGLLVSRDLEWMKGALKFLMGMFWRIVLVANSDKSKTVTCQPGSI